MIGVSRDSEYIPITIRVIGCAILTGVAGGAIGLLSTWLYWPAAPASAGDEDWNIRFGAIAAMFLCATAGAVMGSMLGLVNPCAVRTGAGLGLVLGALAALLSFGLFEARAALDRGDWAMSCFRYLLTGGTAGLILGAAAVLLWRRRSEARAQAALLQARNRGKRSKWPPSAALLGKPSQSPRTEA